jgi:hypothetical protein
MWSSLQIIVLSEDLILWYYVLSLCLYMLVNVLDAFKYKQMLFRSWDELGLRRQLIVTSVVSLNFLLNSLKNLSLTELYMGQ